MQTTDKAELRKTLRSARRALRETQQRTAAAGLLKQLQSIDAFSRSNCIAMYLANDGEISPSDVMTWMLQQGRRPYLPLVRQTSDRNFLLFAEVTVGTDYIDNRFGIAEPVVAESEIVQADQLDMVLLPLVGFDDSGNRIGMGGGFYDTTFEFVGDPDSHKTKPVMIGLAHECQKVPAIAAESWDIPLSVVVTDQTVYQLATS